MFNKKRQILIQKSLVAKEAKYHYILMEGYKAFAKIDAVPVCPYPPGKKRNLWLAGVKMAENDLKVFDKEAIIALTRGHPQESVLLDELQLALSKVPEQSKKQTKRITSKKDLESAVIRECLLWLKEHGIFAWRNNVGAFPLSGGRFIKFGLVGASDIIGILSDGRFLAVECKKRIGGKLSPQQEWFKKKIESNHGVFVMATSNKDLEILI